MIMALTQENVHYTLNSGPGVIKSSRLHARIQEFLSGGGGGGGGSRPDGQKTVWTINLFYSLQSGSNGFIGVQLLPGGGGVQRNPYNL